ncbi:hypothetical protein [Halobellus rufus]|uniref:hypothetical protein n=1 Tax=Halobellus rufus TaxID=1448860 RepID=UPI000679E5C2|nr:hypothetical protein [Halobellus rufus]
MGSTPRTALHLSLAALLLTAGCLGGDTVSTGDAKERALEAEAEYVTQQFENASCVDEWGLESYTGVEREATVANRTSEGVYVDVSQPFWYSTAEVDADVGSEARYLVTENDTRRLDGTDVSPC